MIPKHKPDQERELTEEILRLNGIADPIVILGVRGFFPVESERGTYNDAIFLVTPNDHIAFNANTDPNGFRPGNGHGLEKGMATLMPQLCKYKLGLHKGKYLALVEAGQVRVLRDADASVPDYFVKEAHGHRYYEAYGFFGINIHCGSWSSTSSLGCQTIPPGQYQEFISACESAMKSEGMTTIHYLLIEKENA